MSNVECPICLCAIADGAVPIGLHPCGHVMCDACFNQLPTLLFNARRCPICRADVTSWLKLFFNQEKEPSNNDVTTHPAFLLEKAKCASLEEIHKTMQAELDDFRADLCDMSVRLSTAEALRTTYQERWESTKTQLDVTKTELESTKTQLVDVTRRLRNAERDAEMVDIASRLRKTEIEAAELRLHIARLEAESAESARAPMHREAHDMPFAQSEDAPRRKLVVARRKIVTRV